MQDYELQSKMCVHGSPVDRSDPLINNNLSDPNNDMLLYTIVAALADIETLTSRALIANASAEHRVLDITDLPSELFEAHPRLVNAVANDGRNDASTIQTVVNWVSAQQAAGSTERSTIYIPVGVFDLAKTINVDTANVTFQGAGVGQTVLQNANTFKVGTAGLPDGETTVDSSGRSAYLFNLQQSADNVAFMDMTLRGPEIHGGIFGEQTDRLVIRDMEFNNFLWSAVRLLSVSNARIHSNVFVDAGGQAEGDSGVTGGSIFASYLNNSEIYNNRISESKGRDREVYGIKGRKFENTRIYKNTIRTNFAIELPFEHDSFVEIDHNYLSGAISVPKAAGGKVPDNGFTFHIHHNYFTQSYSLEWARNGAEVDHNVFVFATNKDNGNLISNFDSEPAQGPTLFHNNLILNPGRGIVWHKGIYNNFSFYNNEIIANETTTPRKDGLFGFNEETDFSTIEIRDNLIQANGTSRPLMRNQASYGAVIKNNKLVNISDVNKFNNPTTGAPRGLREPLSFQAGANGEFSINGFEVSSPTAP
ncbi:MAG: right-handed parallel beta-helix repeat-containing protein [Cyanobacteria bacterium P01_H01_bin.26]